MKPAALFLSRLLVLAAAASLCPAEDETVAVSLASLPPSVVRSVPQCGDSAVDPRLGEIAVTFSKEMKVTGHCWSWCGEREETFPTQSGATRFLDDKRTCVLRVALAPDKTYAIWINTDQYQSFQDPAGHPAVPYLLAFRTAPAVATPGE